MDVGPSPNKKFSSDYQAGALSFEFISNGKKKEVAVKRMQNFISCASQPQHIQTAALTYLILKKESMKYFQCCSQIQLLLTSQQCRWEQLKGYNKIWQERMYMLCQIPNFFLRETL